MGLSVELLLGHTFHPRRWERPQAILVATLRARHCPAEQSSAAGGCCLTCVAIHRWLVSYFDCRTVFALAENSMEEAQYIRGPADPGRINLSDEHEMHYWTKLLGVSELRLLVAVAFAGVMASDVRAYLGLQSAQQAAASHGLNGSEYADFYSSAFAGVMASDVRAYLGLQSAQQAAASHGLNGSEYADFYSSAAKAHIGVEARSDKRAPAFFTRFSHAVGSARRKPDG
jgi:hypothetical protein